MNRSFRAPEKGMLVPAAVKQVQPQIMGSFRMKEKEEELSLFLEMRKREKERELLLQNTEAELDSTLGSFGMPAATPARKTGADKFLDSENDKNDYDWLLTPPGTPLFPSLEMESQKTVMAQRGTPKVRPTALKSRLSNSHPEVTGRNNMSSRQPVPSSGLNTSTIGIRRPASSGGPASRPATPTRRPSTPTGRPTLGQSTRPVSSSTKTVSSTTSRSTSTTTSRPSRSSTPTSRPTMGSTKPTLPARSSTPTPRSTARSSTPTSRPSLTVTKPASRASTPTRRQPTLTTVTKPSTPVTKPVSNTTRSSGGAPAPPPRASSPSGRPRPWNPQEMPGYSLDAPPNLRTSLDDRPPSVTRGRPGAPSSRSSSVERVATGRGRRQSCSPSRGRPPNGVFHNSGSSVPVPALNRAYAKANDNTSPGLYGTKMVERVVNMRKLVPPKQDDKHSPRSNLSSKSSPDSSGFGRSLSKKSLDMAIRHMDIRRTVPGNLRPLMTNIPASSMYSVRTGPTRSRTMSVSDSPLATSSNASSEMSVNNNAMCLDGNIDDDISSSERSVMNIRGRLENPWRGSVGGIVDAPIEKVWSIVSQTERLPEWMPMVETCTHLKGTEGEPGYVRLVSGFMFPQEDGDRSWIKERLVSIDPLTHSYVYRMEASNVGLDGSVNSLKLIEYEVGSTLVDWSFEISPVEGASEETLIDYLGYLYKSCINKIASAIRSSGKF